MAVRNHRLAALVFFAAMAVLHSWPLASDPVNLARLDNHDAALNTWIVAWVAHILPRAPLSLFEAPILFPEQHSLAFSEHMFVPSVMGAPLLWLGASPVLVYNLLIRRRGRWNQALSPEMTCPAAAPGQRWADSRASRRSASCRVSSRFEKQKRTVFGAAAGSM